MSDRVDIDLGDHHTLTFTSWRPDRVLNPQYQDLPDIDRLGAIVRHTTPDGADCEGAIMFDSAVARRVFPTSKVWNVEGWEPLTVSASLLCTCGDHGWIKQGRWERA
jgi:hypothetical protein